MDSIRIIRIMDKLQKLVILVKNAETIMVLKENVDSHIQKLNKTVITMESKTTITITTIIIMVDSKIKELVDSEKNVKTSMVLKENVDLNIRNINKILINPIIIIIQIICLVEVIKITTIITCLAEVVIKIMGIKIVGIKELVDLEKNVKTSMVLKENVDSHIQNINKTKPKETITIMVEC